MKTVCETLGVARSNIAARATGSLSRARGRPPLPDRELVENIKAIIADMPFGGVFAAAVKLPHPAETAAFSLLRAKRQIHPPEDNQWQSRH